MKRIGILTYHCIPNFGAQLQTLSTVGFMQKNGFDPIVLNWYPADLEDYYHNRVPLEQNECQFLFSQEKMPVSNLCRNLDELCAEIERLDLNGLFLGSDALFDYTPLCNRYNLSLRQMKRIPLSITSNHLLPNPFWGCFNDMLKHQLPFVGFSISSQNMPYGKLNHKERIELKRLLLGFKALTVRDDWTRKMVEAISGRNGIDITPDPVFSFNQNVDTVITKDELCKKYNLPEKYILISFLYPMLSDDFVNRIICLVEEKTGTECVSFPMPDKLRKFKSKHIINLPLNPVDWYFIIKYSSGYIGERMHPIVVSLHNSVPFFCFDQYGAYKEIIPRLYSKFIPESSKIYDVLKKAGLERNVCFYAQIESITPEIVVDRFLSFDKIKCELFSQRKQNEYKSAMHKIMSLL